MPRPDRASLVERIWFGHDAPARAVRAALRPASGLYALGVAIRNALYDAGVLRQHALALTAVSVGNLSVGGTGKTPVAAWIANELARRGARPGIVLRGYGGDEPEVHRRLNPDLPVVADPDRVAGVCAAAAAGADIAVLDDAFQHRRARRDADVVLVSADRWPDRVLSLPAGPFREGLCALRRASMAVVTRKAARREDAEALRRHIEGAVPGCTVVQVHLAPDELIDAVTGLREPLAGLAGRRVLAICGVGDPAAFARQLSAAGAIVDLRAFPDHHPFGDDDVAALVAAGRSIAQDGGLVVCTLKDAVKLSPRWPPGKPALSLVSQQVILEAGRASVDRLLDSLIHARKPAAAAAG